MAVQDEAASWVADEIARLRAMTYDQLLADQGEALHCEMLTSGGEVLIRETQVFWDDPTEKQNLRVMVDVWNPRKWISTSIISDDFIRAPDGSFVGE